MSLSPAQLAARLGKVTASVAPAVVLGQLSKAYGEIWQIVPFEGNAMTRLGDALEAPLLDYCSAEYGFLWGKIGTVWHPEHPWLGATPDATITLPDGREIGGEVKCRMSFEGWGRDDTDEVPDDIRIQVVIQQACTGVEETWIFALTAGLPRRYIIKRDRELELNTIRVLEHFYREHVEPKKPPPVDGSPECTELLKWMYRRPAPNFLPATSELEALVSDAVKLDAEASEAKKRADAIKNQIRARIGDQADGVRGLVTWKQDVRGVRALKFTKGARDAA